MVDGELSIWVKNNPGLNTIEMKLEQLSELCWNTDRYYPDLHDITFDFMGGSEIKNINEGWIEFLGCGETTFTQHYRTFGLGLYKISAYVNDVYKDYFVIDYRTSELPEINCDIDYPLDFDVSVGKFYYKSSQVEFPESVTIWELLPCFSDVKTELEPLAPENVQVSLGVGGSPYLTWERFETDDFITDYAIYRSVVGGCSSNHGTFTKIATLSESARSFTDYDFYGSGNIKVYYQVVSVNGSRESSNNSIVSLCTAFYKEGTENEINFSYSLGNNYPNPFNPTTIIPFTLKVDSEVKLRVYDILGKEVSILINGVVSAGYHEIEFDGSDIESGIYFYEIITPNFTNVKKLILIK